MFGAAKSIWITWENQRRNITLSNALGVKLFQFNSKYNPFARYSTLLLKTSFTFLREKPSLIFVQNPSLILAFFSVTYGKLFNIPVIVDAHNAGVYPFNGTKWWANKIAIFLFRKAAFTIVTNSALADYVKQNGGRPVILPDPIPKIEHKPYKMKLKGKFNILFVCSWAGDEPYLEVMKAAELLDKEIYIYITGNSKGEEKRYGDILPENVILTGYLSEQDYISMLYTCDVIVDLTTRENCLVCGAYEAVAAEKPLIVSDTKVSREYFSKGALYNNNTAKDLVEKIKIALENNDKMKLDIKKLKENMINEWNIRKNIFENTMKEYSNIFSSGG